jgi:hypothetical protein
LRIEKILPATGRFTNHYIVAIPFYLEDAGFLFFLCPGRVVDILGASGASDSGSNPDRGVQTCFSASIIFQARTIDNPGGEYSKGTGRNDS